MTDQLLSLQSLKQGHWFKLICGASFQHLPSVRSLTLAYTLAGADCIDVAADPAIMAVAKEAIDVGIQLAQRNRLERSPWLMVSLNDGEDPHFRKADFDPKICPSDCPRPCQAICPADAIAFPSQLFDSDLTTSGVLSDRCYGCGRCIPVCPVQHITARAYVSTPQTVVPLLFQMGIDAIEIHTQVGHLDDFRRLWQAIAPGVSQLKLVAISCPDGDGLIDYLRSLHTLISPLPCALVWQTDGRPMSGDIGAGATRAAIKLGQKVSAARLPGFVQLAGGTNHSTVPKLQELGLLLPASSDGVSGQTAIAGVAYGSYARRLLAPVIEQLEHQQIIPAHLENQPQLLNQAVTLAASLVSQLKPPNALPPWLNDGQVQNLTMMR